MKPPSCRNCKGAHPSSSKQCPTWVKEKEIVKIKTEKDISFPEARRLCEPKNAAGPVSYAQAAATSSSASKTTALTKSIATQTQTTWLEDQPKTIATTNSQTQTTNKKSQPTQNTINKKSQPTQNKTPPKKVVVNLKGKHNLQSKTPKPGPKSSKPDLAPRMQTSPKKGKINRSTSRERTAQLELEITNRYSGLSSGAEEEDDMDLSLYEPSSGATDQATEKPSQSS